MEPGDPELLFDDPEATVSVVDSNDDMEAEYYMGNGTGDRNSIYMEDSFTGPMCFENGSLMVPITLPENGNISLNNSGVSSYIRKLTALFAYK